jgi:hypothetical protein
VTEQPYQFGRPTVPGQAARSLNSSAPGPGRPVPAPVVPEPTIRPRPPVAALTGLTLLAGLGGWLLAAPFLLGDQARAAAWTTATRVDAGAGALLTLIALTGLLGYLGAAIGWSARYARN